MKYLKLTLWSILLSIFCQCKNDTNAGYRIVDKLPSIDKKDVWIMVFAPDTNWDEMEAFAIDQLKDKSTASIVSFFYPESEVPRFDTINHSLISSKDYLKYNIANYKCDDEKTGKFRFYKLANRDGHISLP